MRKKIYTFVLLLALIAMPLVARGDFAVDGFKVVLLNNTSTVQNFKLFWVDHKFPGYHKPFPMAMKGLDPGERWELAIKFAPGKYYIRWQMGPKQVFQVWLPTKRVLLTPSRVIKGAY